jgi:hypothetical protein
MVSVLLEKGEGAESREGAELREGPVLAVVLCVAVRPYCATDLEDAKALAWATCCNLPAAGNLFGTSMLCSRG